MAKQTDSKKRMITAARRLFREHGYHGTALSEVISESAAPRGSLYFHFPGGKEELATEVTLIHAADAIAHVNRVAGATDTAGALIAGFMGKFRDELIGSGYREGCAIAPIVIESTPSSVPLADATRRAFADVIAVLGARLTDKDVPTDRARSLATNAVTSMEGALLLSRALRSTEPFEMAITELVASAEAATAH